MWKRFGQMITLATLFALLAIDLTGNPEVLRLKTISGAQAKQLTELRFEVNRLNDRAGFNAGLDPDAEPANLRRWSRRDTADNLYQPDDHAEFTGRHDTFDRRPSAGKGEKP